MTIEAIQGVGKSFQVRAISEGLVGFGAPAEVKSNTIQTASSPLDNLKKFNQSKLNDPINSSRGIFKNTQG